VKTANYSEMDVSGGDFLLGTGMGSCVVAPVVLPLSSVHRQSDLAGVRVLSHVRASVRGDDQHSGHLVRVVAYLMASFGTSGKWHNISLVEVAITVVQSDGGLAAKDDDELLAPVVEVVNELRATRLKLPERAAERPGSDEALRPYSAPVGNVGPHVLRVARQSDGTLGHRLRECASRSSPGPRRSRSEREQKENAPSGGFLVRQPD
jgi:hypothetical protein